VTSDEDELSSLLDQITRCSQRLQQTQLQSPTQQPLQQSPYLSPTRSRYPKNFVRSFKPPVPPMAPPLLPVTRPTSSSIPSQQSLQLNALLFEPNLDNVIQDLETMMMICPDESAHPARTVSSVPLA